jgi:hypothetical protein
MGGEGVKYMEWEKRNIYRILLAITAWKKELGSSRLIGNCSFEMGLEGITCEDTDWIDLAQIRNK